MKRFFPNAGPYNLEQYISMFLWFRNVKAEGRDPFWELVRLISENNSREVFEAAQLVEDDQEGIEFNLEAEEEEDESEDESSDNETDDDEESPVLSCAFCQIMFDEKADILEHVSLEHRLDVGDDVDVEHVEEQQEEDNFCCPICEETFVDKDVVLRHLSSVHNKGMLTSEPEKNDAFLCPFCESDFPTSDQAAQHVKNGC